VSEQGLKERTKYTPLRGPSVKDQRQTVCCLILPPGGGPSGSPGSSCRGRCLVPEFLA
jgi:hypothetical protein